MRNHTAPNADKDDLLFDALHGLRNIIAELRDAIDELREEIQWGNRNVGGYLPSHFVHDPRTDELCDEFDEEYDDDSDDDTEDSPTDAEHDEGPQHQESLW